MNNHWNCIKAIFWCCSCEKRIQNRRKIGSGGGEAQFSGARPEGGHLTQSHTYIGGHGANRNPREIRHRLLDIRIWLGWVSIFLGGRKITQLKFVQGQSWQGVNTGLFENEEIGIGISRGFNTAPPIQINIGATEIDLQLDIREIIPQQPHHRSTSMKIYFQEVIDRIRKTGFSDFGRAKIPLAEVSLSGGKRNEFLKQRAPRWHSRGQCYHRSYDLCIDRQTPQPEGAIALEAIVASPILLI